MNIPPPPKYVSLFTGIGGFDVVLDEAGYECVAQVEINPYCRKVLSVHWPNVLRHKNVKRFVTTGSGSPDLSDVSLICGGFPCQDLSEAGSKVGLTGKRSGLWSEFARIISALNPRVVLVENVRGMRTKGLNKVLGDLHVAGYDACWSTVSSCALGALHMRPRMFIIAVERGVIDGDWTRETRSFFRRHGNIGLWSGGRQPPPLTEKNEANRKERMRCVGNSISPHVARIVCQFARTITHPDHVPPDGFALVVNPKHYKNVSVKTRRRNVSHEMDYHSAEPFAEFDSTTNEWRRVSIRGRLFDHALSNNGRLLESTDFPSSGAILGGRLYRRESWIPHTHTRRCGIWSTPMSSVVDSTGGGGRGSRKSTKENGTYFTGPINPRLAEWLMGFPLDWTKT